MIDAHTTSRDRIEARVERVVRDRWGRFDGWYSDALVAEVAAEVAAAVAAGQVGVAQVTDAYLARVAQVVRGRAVGPVGVTPDMSQSLRDGVTGPEVQARAAVEYRWQVSTGVERATAAVLAAQRAWNMASTDLGLAFQHQTRTFMTVTGADGYRRVIRPERSKGGTCGLCVAASNRVYYKTDLMPLHGGCHCTVVEVGGDVDEGLVVNDEEYARIAGESDSLNRKDLRKVRVQVQQHGELGPVLTDAGHDFRGPAQVAA